MSATQVFPAISILVTICSLSWAVFVAMRKGDISRPTLKVAIGFTTASANIIGVGESKTRRIKRSTLILAGQLKNGEMGFFPVTLCVRNGGTTSLRNVRVSLDYPAEHYLS